jgi:hypothetical protein
MMALDDAGGSMCEARLLSFIARPRAIAPTPASRQGRSLPLIWSAEIRFSC